MTGFILDTNVDITRRRCLKNKLTTFDDNNNIHVRFLFTCIQHMSLHHCSTIIRYKNRRKTQICLMPNSHCPKPTRHDSLRVGVLRCKLSRWQARRWPGGPGVQTPPATAMTNCEIRLNVNPKTSFVVRVGLTLMMDVDLFCSVL